MDRLSPPKKGALRPKSQIIGPYQLGDQIGKGAFGVVYRGLNTATAEIVAIKQFDIGKGDLSSLATEIQILQDLEHPNIVRYIDFIQNDDHMNLVLEYVESGSLLGVIKQFGELSENLISVYIEQCLKGLVYLHSQGVVHLDIKAANILATKRGELKLTDFGVSKAIKDIQQGGGEAIGTPYWMSPELIELKPATSAADIYSLGCTVYELLTGSPPFSDFNAMSAMFHIVSEEVQLPEGISEELNDFLRSCFKKDPLERPNAAQLLRHDFIQKHRQNQPSQQSKKLDQQELLDLPNMLKKSKTQQDIKGLKKSKSKHSFTNIQALGGDKAARESLTTAMVNQNVNEIAQLIAHFSVDDLAKDEVQDVGQTPQVNILPPPNLPLGLPPMMGLPNMPPPIDQLPLHMKLMKPVGQVVAAPLQESEDVYSSKSPYIFDQSLPKLAQDHKQYLQKLFEGLDYDNFGLTWEKMMILARCACLNFRQRSFIDSFIQTKLPLNVSIEQAHQQMSQLAGLQGAITPQELQSAISGLSNKEGQLNAAYLKKVLSISGEKLNDDELASLFSSQCQMVQNGVVDPNWLLKAVQS